MNARLTASLRNSLDILAPVLFPEPLGYPDRLPMAGPVALGVPARAIAAGHQGQGPSLGPPESMREPPYWYCPKEPEEEPPFGSDSQATPGVPSDTSP